ncbi:MAG: hypothetical protein SGPRY_003615 [Prymnesium sp.]
MDALTEPSLVAQMLAFQRKADQDAEAGITEASSAHKPNLLNTMVFLVQTSQQACPKSEGR